MPSQLRGEAKRAQMLRAAASAFLSAGYLATTVDEIAAESQASKRTVYKHFGDKERLFREVIKSTIAPMQARLQEQLDLAVGEGVEASLRALAHALARIIVTPQVVQLRRLVIAESERFPDLAEEWYRLGPMQTVARLAERLRKLSDDGALRIDDAEAAAEQLLWLSVSAPLNRLMFAPPGRSASRAELRRTADLAFETFWRAHQPDHPPQGD